MIHSTVAGGVDPLVPRCLNAPPSTLTIAVVHLPQTGAVVPSLGSAWGTIAVSSVAVASIWFAAHTGCSCDWLAPWRDYW